MLDKNTNNIAKIFRIEFIWKANTAKDIQNSSIAKDKIIGCCKLSKRLDMHMQMFGHTADE